MYVFLIHVQLRNISTVSDEGRVCTKSDILFLEIMITCGCHEIIILINEMKLYPCTHLGQKPLWTYRETRLPASVPVETMVRMVCDHARLGFTNTGTIKIKDSSMVGQECQLQFQLRQW